MARKIVREVGLKPERAMGPWEPVTLEPRIGHSDRDVLAALKSIHAEEVERLAPGFLSANIPPDSIEKLHTVAEVHRKVRKQMH
jgi:hypothetical protein